MLENKTDIWLDKTSVYKKRSYMEKQIIEQSAKEHNINDNYFLSRLRLLFYDYYFYLSVDMKNLNIVSITFSMASKYLNGFTLIYLQFTQYKLLHIVEYSEFISEINAFFLNINRHYVVFCFLYFSIINKYTSICFIIYNALMCLIGITSLI